MKNETDITILIDIDDFSVAVAGLCFIKKEKWKVEAGQAYTLSDERLLTI
ncbi:hypothetical protein C900_02257 [Fulvivirga imtechensis AK7]|uniref:Uncharacterized protein n=1 Tax=Fulvivirga imtechensis AK7 TaxID=1237149 RepID=L8JXD6_9BACT|nr:hypothetical protein C900_02257 [Fulvivirga imtechensis AK7]